MAERDNNRKNQGQGNFGNHDQHVEAGRLGGEATANSHDKSFYEEIGSEGGSANNGNNTDQNSKNSSEKNGEFKSNDERTREAGREGGRNSHSGGKNR